MTANRHSSQLSGVSGCAVTQDGGPHDECSGPTAGHTESEL